MMSDVELPVAHIRAQVAAAIDVIVQLARLRDGRRVVWEIAVVEGTRHGESIVEPVFRSSLREGAGSFPATGRVPMVVDTLWARGEQLPDALVEASPDRPAVGWPRGCSHIIFRCDTQAFTQTRSRATSPITW